MEFYLSWISRGTHELVSSDTLGVGLPHSLEQAFAHSKFNAANELGRQTLSTTERSSDVKMVQRAPTVFVCISICFSPTHKPGVWDGIFLFLSVFLFLVPSWTGVWGGAKVARTGGEGWPGWSFFRSCYVILRIPCTLGNVASRVGRVVGLRRHNDDDETMARGKRRWLLMVLWVVELRRVSEPCTRERRKRRREKAVARKDVWIFLPRGKREGDTPYQRMHPGSRNEREGAINEGMDHSSGRQALMHAETS